MNEFKTTNKNRYGIVFGYGILKQIEGSLFKMLTDETIEQIQKKWAKASKNGGQMEMTEGEIWNFLSPADFRNMVIGNVDYGLETFAKMIRTFNDVSIGDNYDQRYDFVLGMDPDDGRQLADYVSDQVEKFTDGLKQQGESKPSTAALGAEKALVTPTQP